MKELIIAAICAIGLWNFFVFLLYGIDKHRAQKGQWRISESVLITSAFLMGGLGASLGMKIFRHKTKHLKFQILVPLALILNLVAIGFICFPPLFENLSLIF